MKNKIIILVIALMTQSLFANNITLDELRKKAINCSPLAKKYETNSKKYSLIKKNLNVNYYPSLNMNGKASYQSDAFELPIELPPNLGTIPEISRDQYSIQFNINQTIYDGGVTSSLKKLKKTENNINDKSIETSLYQINQIITDLYFSILTIDANINSLKLIHNDLSEKRKVIKSAVENGTKLKSSLNSIDIEISKLNQELISLKSERKSIIEMLEDWTEQDLSGKQFIIPDNPDIKTENRRPEYELFSARKNIQENNKDFLKSDYMPKVGAFVKAGYGKPNPINFISDEFEGYYIVGLQLSWNLWQWNKLGRELEISELEKELIHLEEENFRKNLNISIKKDINNIEKYRNLINSDVDLIEKQKENVEISFSQFNNGIINSTEYITEQNILKRLIINNNIHKIQLLKTKYDLIYKKGGFNNLGEM